MIGGLISGFAGEVINVVGLPSLNTAGSYNPSTTDTTRSAVADDLYVSCVYITLYRYIIELVPIVRCFFLELL